VNIITYTGENVGFVHFKRSLMAANKKCSRGKKTKTRRGNRLYATLSERDIGMHDSLFIWDFYSRGQGGVGDKLKCQGQIHPSGKKLIVKKGK
jgi:hypothetical protein